MTFFEASSLSNVVFERDPFGKPVSTFPDHALMFEHDLFGKLFRIMLDGRDQPLPDSKGR
jgi:hypothetical protein